MTQTPETNTQSDATVVGPINPGPTDGTVLPEKKIKLNRAQRLRMIAMSKPKGKIMTKDPEMVRKAKRKKRKIQRASRKRNRK